MHGRHDPTIRSATTLEALAQLVHAGYVDIRDGAPLSDAYRFLRTVEHRLQLWDEQQTHTLPTDEVARLRLAHVLGYRGRADESAVEQFEADHRRHQAQVRSIHEKLFFGPLLDTLAGRPGPLNLDAAEERLRAFGFLDLAATRAAFTELTHGLTRTSRPDGSVAPGAARMVLASHPIPTSRSCSSADSPKDRPEPGTCLGRSEKDRAPPSGPAASSDPADSSAMRSDINPSSSRS